MSQAEEYLHSGQQNLESGNYLIALFFFERAIALNPELPEVWEGKASTLRQLGRHEEAIVASEEAITLRMNIVGNNAEFWFKQGIIQLETEDFTEAITSFDQALAIKPDFAEALVNRGVVLHALGKFHEALSSFDRVIFEFVHASAWKNRGRVLNDLERYDEAIDSYNQALQINPNYVEALYELGALFNNLKRYPEALDYSRQAIVIEPKDSHAWYVNGYALDGLGFHEKAITSFDQAIKLEPDKLEAWLSRGYALAKLCRYDEAIICFNEAIKFKPDFYIAWDAQGVSLENLGRYDEAIICYDQCLRIKPDSYETWNKRGLALFFLGLADEAIKNYKYAINLEPNFYLAWFNLGAVLASLRLHEESIINYEKAIKLNPNFHHAWGNRGIELMNLGHYDAAITNFDRGFIHIPQDTQPNDWGDLHRGKGDIYRYQAQRTLNNQPAKLQYYQKALKCYQTALQTLEAFPKAHLELIQSFIKTYLGLANPKAANQWRIEGLEIFRQLLNAQPTPHQKRRIEVQFSGFSQVSVDALISVGNPTVALETAERYKNRCLTWILDEWQEQDTSPSYAEMRELVDKKHEIIYWHLSRETLTTFILTPNQEPPIVLTQKSTHVESWQKDWDKRYSDYRSKGKDQAHHLAGHFWRDTLKEELDRLKDILEIDKIESSLSPETQLILIPHRDLHRFPLHALFGDNRITTYLPSIKVGLAQKPQSASLTRFLLNVEDPTRPDQAPLEFAQLESAILQAIFTPNVKVVTAHRADRLTVETALNGIRTGG